MKLILLALASALAQTTNEDFSFSYPTYSLNIPSAPDAPSFTYTLSIFSYSFNIPSAPDAPSFTHTLSLPSFTYSLPENSATSRATSPGSLGNSVSGSSITTRATSSNGVQVMVCEAGGGGCWDQDMPVSQHSGRSYTTITQTPGATQDDDDDDDEVSSARTTGSASNSGASNAGSSAARSSAAVDSNRAAIVSVCGGVLAMVFANLL